jgi:hypothetical protein
VTTFSVLEGAGRTLKGRDLRQVWMPFGGRPDCSIDPLCLHLAVASSDWVSMFQIVLYIICVAGC